MKVTINLEPKKWDDTFSLVIYPTRLSMEYDVAELANCAASKRVLLQKVAESEEISSDLVYLISHINSISDIEVLVGDSEASIKTDENEIVLTDISDNFTKVLISCCRL